MPMSNLYDGFVLRNIQKIFFTIFTNQLIRVFTLKLNLTCFIVVNIVATRQVITLLMSLRLSNVTFAFSPFLKTHFLILFTSYILYFTFLLRRFNASQRMILCGSHPPISSSFFHSYIVLRYTPFNNMSSILTSALGMGSSGSGGSIGQQMMERTIISIGDSSSEDISQDASSKMTSNQKFHNGSSFSRGL